MDKIEELLGKYPVEYDEQHHSMIYRSDAIKLAIEYAKYMQLNKSENVAPVVLVDLFNKHSTHIETNNGIITPAMDLQEFTKAVNELGVQAVSFYPQKEAVEFHKWMRDNEFREIQFRKQWHSTKVKYAGVYDESELYQLFKDNKQ